MPVNLPKTRAKAQFELTIARDYETLDRIYDVVDLCGFSVDHVEVVRAGAACHCHLVVEGWACGLDWLDDSIRSVRGAALAGGDRICTICRAQGVR